MVARGRTGKPYSRATVELSTKPSRIHHPTFHWLLEAVRDAQEGNKDLPPELLKELAKTLFNGGSESPSESHPQAGIELLLKGLSSIRVKSSEGAEVEAKRGK